MSPSEKKARAALPPPAKWIVEPSKKCLKQMALLPEAEYKIMLLLWEELREEGPEQPEWRHFSQLKGQKGQKRDEKRYHCHIAAGRPTYVAFWKVWGNLIEINIHEIDIYYVGSHEKAPYS